MRSNKIKILFIINPKSGVMDKTKLVDQILEYLDTSKYEPEFQWTKYSGHGFKLARQAAMNHIPVVVSVGGDGSVHNVASGLVGYSSALGIIPIGSGNGLARHLQIATNVQQAVITLNQMKIRSIDIGKINNKFFFNVAGFGFDGKIAKLFAKTNKRGIMKYAQLVMREFVKTKPDNFTIQFENGQTLTEQALMISMANASEFGNGFSISPMSNMHDGCLELVVTKKPGLFAFPGILQKAIKQQVHRSRYIKTYRFRRINIISGNHEFHADGEPISVKYPATIEVIPKALKVIAGENYV